MEVSYLRSETLRVFKILAVFAITALPPLAHGSCPVDLAILDPSLSVVIEDLAELTVSRHNTLTGSSQEVTIDGLVRAKSAELERLITNPDLREVVKSEFVKAVQRLSRAHAEQEIEEKKVEMRQRQEEQEALPGYEKIDSFATKFSANRGITTPDGSFITFDTAGGAPANVYYISPLKGDSVNTIFSLTGDYRSATVWHLGYASKVNKVFFSLRRPLESKGMSLVEAVNPDTYEHETILHMDKKNIAKLKESLRLKGIDVSSPNLALAEAFNDIKVSDDGRHVLAFMDTYANGLKEPLFIMYDIEEKKFRVFNGLADKDAQGYEVRWALHPSGEILSFGDGKEINLFDLRNNKFIAKNISWESYTTKYGHHVDDSEMTFSPDGQFLASLGPQGQTLLIGPIYNEDGSIKEEIPQEVLTFGERFNKSDIFSITFNSDSSEIILGTSTGSRNLNFKKQTIQHYGTGPTLFAYATLNKEKIFTITQNHSLNHPSNWEFNVLKLKKK